jgi:hypothetical protein
VISKQQMILDDSIEPGSNMAIFQITGPLPLEVDFHFASGNGNRKVGGTSMATKEGLTEQLQKAETRFDERFDSTFQLQEKVNCEPTRQQMTPFFCGRMSFRREGSVPRELNMSFLRKRSFAGPFSDAA